MKALVDLYFDPRVPELWDKLYAELEKKKNLLFPLETDWNDSWSISTYGQKTTLHIKSRSVNNKKVYVRTQIDVK